MSEKMKFDNRAPGIDKNLSVKKTEKVETEKLVDFEEFKEDFFNEIYFLLEEKGLLSFENENSIKFLLNKVALFLSQKKDKEFVSLQRALSDFIKTDLEYSSDPRSANKKEELVAGEIPELREAKENLLAKFNRVILRQGKHSFYKLLENYVSNYPEAIEFSGESSDGAKLFAALPVEDFKTVLSDKNLKYFKDDLYDKRSFDQGALQTLSFYLYYLSAIKDKLKGDLYGRFLAEKRKLAREANQPFLNISLVELEALFKGGNNAMNDESLSKRERDSLGIMLKDWGDFLFANEDFNLVEKQRKNVFSLKKDLLAKSTEYKKEVFALNDKPESYREKIENEDLGSFWLGKELPENLRPFRLIYKLNRAEQMRFLNQVEKGDLVSYTVAWLKDSTDKKLNEIAKNNGYFKENPEKLMELRRLLADFFAMWPKEIDLYNEDEQEEIIHEFFAPYERRDGDEGFEGKFVRWEFLLDKMNKVDNKNKNTRKYFVEDDDSFNLLCGEINEMMVKEILIDKKELDLLRNIVSDSIYSRLFDHPKMLSLIDDILTNENLSKVQEDLWLELINILADYFKAEIGKSMAIEEEGSFANGLLGSISSFDKRMGLKVKREKIKSAKTLGLIFAAYELSMESV